MSYELRIENLGEQHIAPHALLSRAEYGDSVAIAQESHLRWKFLDNPQGPSVGIHLYKNRELVGRLMALTRIFVHQQKTYRAAHIVDFLVHPDERGMGSLFQLVSGLKQLSGFDFQLIMAPNPAGTAVWKKLVKMREYFDLDIAVAPLRPAALLQSTGKFKSGMLAPIMDWPCRLMVGGAAWVGSHIGTGQIQVEWPEDAEIDRMLFAVHDGRVVGQRSAAFLKWRYRDSPVFQYKVFFLRRKGELCGYFVTRKAPHDDMECLFIVDAYGLPSMRKSCWRAASHAAVAQAAGNGAELAMIFGNTASGSLAVMNTLPFITVPPRLLPRKPTVYAEWGASAPAFEINRDNFFIALGDCDFI
jgi:hypothetical protein